MVEWFLQIIIPAEQLTTLEHCMKILWNVMSSWLLGNILVVSAPVVTRVLEKNERRHYYLSCFLVFQSHAFLQRFRLRTLADLP